LYHINFFGSKKLERENSQNNERKVLRMIPKTIHYCWFGGKPLPALASKCIASWRKYCPDYEIIRWDERNFDIHQNLYMKQAYEAKKWAFVSDYARLKIIYDHGGVYFDTDVEVLKPIDDLLEHNCFIGTEKPGTIATGLGFGAVKGHWAIKAMLNEYENEEFIKNGIEDLTPCPVRNTRPFLALGFKAEDRVETINDCTIYSVEYFCPKDYVTRRLKVTHNTYTIHHFDGSWLSMWDRIKIHLKQIIGPDWAELLLKKKHEFSKEKNR